MKTRKWSVVKINRQLWALSIEREHEFSRDGYPRKRDCYQLARILGLDPANEIKTV